MNIIKFNTRTVRKVLEENRIIEAALFSAGKPLSIDDIKESTELSEKAIKNAVKSLIKEYAERDTALEIAKVGDKYAMQLKSSFASHVQKFAEMEIPYKVLKTAALIAYHQPVKQSELLTMVGHKVYDHTGILNELGLIRKRDSGRTKLITTTERFSEYFGISTTDRDEIKKWLLEKLNLPIPDKKPEQLKITSDEVQETEQEAPAAEEDAGTEEQPADVNESENTATTDEAV